MVSRRFSTFNRSQRVLGVVQWFLPGLHRHIYLDLQVSFYYYSPFLLFTSSSSPPSSTTMNTGRRGILVRLVGAFPSLFILDIHKRRSAQGRLSYYSIWLKFGRLRTLDEDTPTPGKRWMNSEGWPLYILCSNLWGGDGSRAWPFAKLITAKNWSVVHYINTFCK